MSKNICNHETRREDWGTPIWLYKRLDAIFGFQWDLAAHRWNALAPNWFSPGGVCISDIFHCEEGGIMNDDLACSFVANEWKYCNPPYGPNGCGEWMTRLLELNNTVDLIPASTGSAWFRQCWQRSDAIVQFHKRLRFEGAPGPAQFDSCLVVKGDDLTIGQMHKLSELGTVIHRGGIIDWKGTWFGK